jgi:hypothetical protein
MHKETLRKLLTVGLPLALVACAAATALQPELRLSVPLLVGTTAAMTGLLALAGYLGERGRLTWTPGVILAVALLLRLPFLFTPPQLSDDIYRYLWDGWQLLHGTSPYALAPAAAPPDPAMAGVHRLINHPQYVTIYPPMAQLIFAAGALFGGTVTGLKALLLLVDLGLCLVIMKLLQRLRLSLWQSVLYAWNPLALIEIAGSGHVDGSGLALFLAAALLLVCAEDSPRPWPYPLAGALVAAAGLVKLFPLALAPLIFPAVPRPRRRLFLAGFGAGIAALLLPFLPGLARLAATLNTYARNWEFAGFAFATLRRLTGSGNLSRLVLIAAFLVVVCAIAIRLRRHLATMTLAADRWRLVLTSCQGVAMAMLLLTPTLQPWYALSLAALLPFAPGPAGLTLCWAVFLTYRVQLPYYILGQWTESPWVTGAVFLAPVTAWALARVFARLRG